MKFSPTLDARARPSQLAIFLLGVFALGVRMVYFRRVGGLVFGGDSSDYLRLADSLSSGNWSEVLALPLYAFYPSLIAFGSLIGASQKAYLLALQIGLSTATVVFLFLTAARITSLRWASFSGLVAAVYPVFLFWMPYVLSDTAFLCVASLLLWATVTYVQEPTPKHLAGLFIVSFLFLFARPVSLATLPVVGLFALYAYLTKVRKVSAEKAAFALVTGIAAIVFAGVGLVWSSPSLQDRLLHDQAAASALGLAVRLDSNNYDEYFRATAERTKQIAERGELTRDQRNGSEIKFALDRITQSPGHFGKMCLKRMVAFWAPAMYQGRWSKGHVLLDFGLLFFLLLGVLAVFFQDETKLEDWALLFIAFSFSILPALTHVDTDGRYRLPAELVLVLLSGVGYGLLLQTWLFPKRVALSPSLGNEP